MTKIVAVSDLHGYLPNIPPCDILLISGDLCPAYDHSLNFQELWLRTNFYEWRRAQPAKNCIICAGNHDFIFRRTNMGWSPKYTIDYEINSNLTWLRYLEDDAVTVCDLKIWGSPWQKPFYDWAFNMPEEQMAEKWAAMPDDVDIIVSHGPPYGYGDYVRRDKEGWFDKKGEYEHLGSPSLTKRIQEVKPKLVVYGHIHSGYGKYQLGDSVLLNSSYVNESYIPVNKPWEITL